MVDALTLQLSNIWRHFAMPGLSSLAIPLVLFCIIVMMVIPLPPILLDLFFTANIALSLIIVMICISALKPLDFSSFPTVLLFATLLRLALNVASTRVVLVDGHTGPDAAGNVIEAFGEFIIAGNYLIGIIVFSILMIINFVVVTKGAGRVSEVRARSTRARTIDGDDGQRHDQRPRFCAVYLDDTSGDFRFGSRDRLACHF